MSALARAVAAWRGARVASPAAGPLPPAGGGFAEFAEHFAHYERRFRDLALTRSPNQAERRLVRAAWDLPAARALLEEVLAEKTSATAAAVKLGWTEPRTPGDELRSAWRRASPDQKAAFAAEFADELRSLMNGEGTAS